MLPRQLTPVGGKGAPAGFLCSACLVVALLFFLVGPAPAPDLKLPPFPNFFKKGDDELQETAQAPAGPGGMCILPSGDYVVAFHQFFNPPFRVMKLDREKSWVPFPNAEMNTPGSGNPMLLDSVLGIASDARGIVWMLDNGRRSGTPPKLVAWDTKRNQHHKVIVIDGRLVITGSYNFSRNADRKNDENVLMIASPVVASAYLREFERLYR